MRYFLEIMFTLVLMTTFVGGQRQGDLCVMAGTIQPGVCRHITRCSAVLVAAFQGLPYQVCASPENKLIVCCPWISEQETRLQARCQANTTTPEEGDNCTMVDTGRAGVCSRFANCQTAIEAATKGQSPQICTVEGTTPIICCPLVTVTEGDQCSVAETGRAGKCLRLSKCPVAVEAALTGITPQICALDGSVPLVCCEGVVEGDNCTVADTGKAGVCRPFANCQTAKTAASKGILPQTCDLEGTVQIVCCHLSTVVEGSRCEMAGTGRTGVCRPFANCQSAKEASFKGIFPQTCDVGGTVQNVCCPPSIIVEGDNCTVLDTGKMGVCKPFANCQTAKEATNKGILPQTCDVEGTVQIICCPPSTVVEGDNCTIMDTGKAGVCKLFANCQTAKTAASKGILPQTCDKEGTAQIICCPPSTVVKGDNCTIVDTGMAGVCKPFANCQTAKTAASKGILPQTCDIEGTVQIICCPPSTVVEGSHCAMADTGRMGVCKPFSNCQSAKEASFKGIFPQTCEVEGTMQNVCCSPSTIVEGDNCTVVDTGKVGVCRPFASCQTAKEAANKGILPQACDKEGTAQIICCPPSTVVEGDNCTIVDTGKAGVCKPFANCQTAKTAASKGILPQTCDKEGTAQIICCPPSTVVKGDNCNIMDTGKAGVCKPFSNCQTAKTAASKGILPQTCDIEGTVQIICCPPSTVVEGSRCAMADTGKMGVCRPFANCQSAKEASFKGIFPQTCEVEGTMQNVCCSPSTIFEGDNCTVVDTGKVGVCRPFASCQTAKEAANKGILPQACDKEGTAQIICCPPSRVVEGDNCTIVDTRKAGVCKPFANCQTAKTAASKGILPQICDKEGTAQIICCPPSTVVEGDNCNIMETGKAGVCKPFANCQTAKTASSKGILPQTCDVEGNVQIICCPPLTVVEGSHCAMAGTGRTGVCRPFANCLSAKEASFKGIFPQTCDVEGDVQNVCCPLAKIVEGSQCILKHTGLTGVCKPFANCQSAQVGSSKGILPQKCDLTDNESELVCCTKGDCPPLPKGLVTQLPVGSKAADYCIELAEKIHPCQETRSGWTRGDICPLLTPDSNVEHHFTPVKNTAEASYLGQIGSGRRGNITWHVYPVSLVSDQWVLCSAIGIKWMGSSNVKFVGLGGTLKPRYNPDQIYGVTKQHLHPLYDHSYSYVYNSIALLQLDRRVTFTASILPACLHTGTPLPGRGFLQTSSHNLKTTMRILSQEECSEEFSSSSSGHPDGVKHDQEICSRPINTTEKCPGWFAGAPLTLHNSHRVACTHLLVGLRSDYYSCTTANSRISSFIPWIEGIVWPETSVVV